MLESILQAALFEPGLETRYDGRECSFRANGGTLRCQRGGGVKIDGGGWKISENFNKRGGQNQRGRWEFFENLINIYSTFRVQKHTNNR